MSNPKETAPKETPAPAAGNEEQAPAAPAGEGLSDEAAHAVSEALHQIRVAIQNIRLYPEGSPQALRAAGTAYAPIAQLLEGREGLTFGVKEGKFLVNGTLFKPSDDRAAGAVQRFSRMLSDSAISSISFSHEMTVEELNTFLDGFSRRKWSQTNIREVTADLQKRGVHHIALNEQVYVALGENDVAFVVEKGKAAVDQSADARDRIMKALTDVTRMVGEIPDKDLRDQTKLEIAKKIIELDPELLPKLLQDRKLRPPKTGGSDLRIAGFDADEMIEIVDDFIRFYRDLEHAGAEKRGTDRELGQMKAIVNRLLSLCRDRGESKAMMEKLLQEGAGDLAPAWTDGKPDELASLVARAEEMIQKDPLLLLREDQRENVQSMVRELDAEQKTEVMARLLGQLGQGLQARQPDVRLKAVRRLKELQATFQSVSHREMIRDLDGRVIAMMESEPDSRVYQEAGDLLEHVLGRSLAEKDLGAVAKAVSLLRRHSQEKGEAGAKRAKAAAGVLAGLAQAETVRTVVAELLSGETHHRDAARDILIRFGADGLPALMAEIKETKERSERFVLADVLKGIGGEAIARLMGEAKQEPSPAVVARLLDMAPQLGHETETLEHLKAMLNHANPQIRIAVVKTIRRMKGEKAAELIASALQDTDPYVVIEAMNGVEELPSGKAVPSLVDLVRGRASFTRDETSLVMETASHVLRKMGRSEAIADLMEIAKAPPFLRRLFGKGGASDRRCAAVRALAGCKDRPEVRQFLGALQRDSDVHVRDTARRCGE